MSGRETAPTCKLQPIVLTNAADFDATAAKRVGSTVHGIRDREVTELDRDEVIRANLVAAQHELDELLNQGTGRLDFATLADHLVRANLYILEAERTRPLGSRESAAIAATVASLHAAVTAVASTVRRDHSTLVTGVQVHLDQLATQSAALMRHYRVRGGQRTPSRCVANTGPIEVDAVNASLVLARLEASRGFRALIDAVGDARARAPIVSNTAMLVEGHLRHAALMMGGFEDAQLASIAPAIELTSASILQVKRWMDKREGNAILREAFRGVLQAANTARARVGLGPLDLGEVRGFPEREEAEEAQEQRDMDAAMSDLDNVWRNVHAAMEEGVEQWYELAKKADQARPSFIESLLESLLTEAVGKIGGLLAKRLFEAAAGVAARNLSIPDEGAIGGALKDALMSTTSNTAKGMIGDVLTAARADVNAPIHESDGTVSLKPLLFVRGGLKHICRSFTSEHVKAAHEGRRRGELSVTDVKSLVAIALQAEKTAMPQLKAQSATDWVRYVAQASLRDLPRDQRTAAHSVSSEKTNLDGYFGTYHKEGVRTPTGRTGNHEGRAGMLHVNVKTFEDGVNGRTDLLFIEDFHVNGLNLEMTKLLFEHGSNRTLDDLKVPKEVFVHFKLTRVRGEPDYRTLKLAIDEAGSVKDIHAGPGIEGARVDEIFDAGRLWSRIRALPISRSQVRKQ